MKLLLASSSPYRKALLTRLNLDFQQSSPDINETPEANESPKHLVMRLAQKKAAALASQHPETLIIASDQAADLNGRILGKPGTVEKAIDQLGLCSGQKVVFHTGLCLLNTATGASQCQDIEFTVWFRQLHHGQIRHYIETEKPLDCAGSFKCEGLGVALFEKMAGNDPNSLVGLPLITLVSMLANEGVDVLS